MDSAHQELHFLLLWASQLSKRSSGGLGEVKKTVDGNTKFAFPEIYPADRPPALKLLLALSGHKIWAISGDMFENRPPLVSQDPDFEGGSILKIFRPPSGAGFWLISEGGTLLNFKSLRIDPPFEIGV